MTNTDQRILSIIFCLVVVSLVILPVPLQAKTMVLIHGYMAEGMSWRNTKVTNALVRTGWKDGGQYSYRRQGMLIPKNVKLGSHAFFTVDLPSKSPIDTQARFLQQYVKHLYAIRKEPIIFVGHSAGGIVARFYLVAPTHVPVRSLITIGTPHLGTPTADWALLASNSPLGIMLDIAGQEDMRDSRGLFSDLKIAKPSTFLYWLNHQPHPRIPYVSIIRNNKDKKKRSTYDFIVPTDSQNMNNVAALSGQSWAYLTQENHFLNHKDGGFLVDILKRIQ
ncbi:MAG: alpha/beta fold hydrolase [Cocleimonas sp.]|nr:alpha/beta fold hydrolase [Cocleimonas sp.]